MPMTVHLVTFATSDMSKSLDLCYESAWRNGMPRHNLHDWTFEQLCDLPLMELRPSTYWANRGVGYWLWKPYLIELEMRKLQKGDDLIYADAGIEFIAPVSHIIDRMDQDIFLFGNNWEHAHWCKRDVVETVWPDYRMGTVKTEDDYRYRSEQMWLRFGRQCQASVIFFRVSDYTRAFTAEWLDWCLFEGGRLIDDSPSRAPNHPEFREHRHDQAILTTMAYRDGLRLHWWGARYNMDQPDGGFVYPKLPEYAADNYEPFVHHHRKRNADWK
jgi:hypothetical protein